MIKKIEFTTENNKTTTTNNYHTLLLIPALLEENIEKIKTIFSIILEEKYQQDSTYMNRFLSLRTEQIINKHKFTSNDISLYSYCFANAIFDKALLEETTNILSYLEKKFLANNELLKKQINWKDKVTIIKEKDINKYYDKSTPEPILQINNQEVEPNYLIPTDIDIAALDMLEKYAYIVFEVIEITNMTKNGSVALAYNLEDSSLELVKYMVSKNNIEKKSRPKTRRKSVI